MFNKKKQLIQEQERTIMELNEELQNLQLEMDNVKSQLEAYKQRELSISRALTDAAETASRIVTDAQRESDDIHDSAQKVRIRDHRFLYGGFPLGSGWQDLRFQPSRRRVCQFHRPGRSTGPYR